jgi:hypothetical protein
MARFIALAGGLGFALAVLGGTHGWGQTEMMMATNAAAGTPPNAAPGKPAPPPAPPIPEDYYVRFGKILKAGDQPAYPFKLNMPFPGVGEVKVPSKEELEMRAKLEQLATLSDDEIRAQLLQWPAFGKMSLADDGTMLQRIQAFRDYRHKAAMDAQHRLGLLTLNPAQQAKFEKEFWDKKLEMDRQLAQQMEAAYKAAQQKMNENLYREFSSPGALAKATSPPAKPMPAPAGPALAH